MYTIIVFDPDENYRPHAYRSMGRERTLKRAKNIARHLRYNVSVVNVFNQPVYRCWFGREQAV